MLEYMFEEPVANICVNMMHIHSSNSVGKFRKKLQKDPTDQNNKTNQKVSVLPLEVYKLHQ